jgi:hypothetical protein
MIISRNTIFVSTDNYLEWAWKKVIVPLFEVLSGLLHGSTEEIHKKPQ